MRENKGPFLTADVIIENGEGIVLVRRKHPPLGWALPGGFAEIGEFMSDAAVREAKEETGLDVAVTELFHVYSDPQRDPRGLPTVTAVFIGTATGQPVGADDAAEARVFPIGTLPSVLPTLAFDHGLIVKDYLAYRAGQGRPPARR